MSETKIGYKDILKQKEYLKMILAALINRFGDSIDAIAFTWIVYELTGSAAWSAIIFGINRLPSVFITPFAGAWVEGRKKKNVMIVTDYIRAVCVALVATGYIFEFLHPWMLLVITLVISTAEAFRIPANFALTPKVLDKKYFEYGMSLLQTLSSVVELIGMAVAGGIIAITGTAGAIYIDMLTFIVSGLIIMFVKTKEENMMKNKFVGKEYLHTLSEGIVYVREKTVICFLLGIVLFVNAILIPYNSLKAPLVSQLFQGGAEVLSLIGIMFTIGMLLGSAAYPTLKRKCTGKFVLANATIVIGIFYLGVVVCLPLYDNKIFMYVFVAVINTLFGFAIAMANSFLNVEFIKRVDENFLARVGGITSAISSAAMPLVSFLISAIVAYLEIKELFIGAGILAILVAVFLVHSKILNEERTKNTDDSTQVEVINNNI